ncbi:MAG: ABC transporter ATP-binding protein [Oscillochloris sp.]|nr:ABC transporter ATP-binding protein [Oscillochloris sp.]
MEASRSADPQGDAIIRLERVTKSYIEGERAHTVLHEVDMHVATGELVALVGKSGSGKSTLLNLISGIDQPDSGSIWVAGQHLSHMREHERTLFRREQIGFVFQFFNLVPTLTVLENVLLPLELNGRGGSAGQAVARSMLAEVGLSDRAQTYPDRLSGGEQQRIAIARALAHEPALILADEPTGNLDDETGRLVLDLLDRLTRRAGRTMIMVTHSREVAALADRAFAVRDGCLRREPLVLNQE